MTGPLTQALLHSLSHSSSDVFGLLIGPSNSTPDSISRAIPLFHSRCVSTPLVRTALSLVERTLAPDMTIVGVYFAQVSPVDKSVPPIAKWIATQICRTLGVDSIVCWGYDAKLASSTEGEWPFKGYVVKQDETVVVHQSKQLTRGFGSEHVRDFIDAIHKTTSLQGIKCLEVVDFEDHLQDPAREWLVSN